MKLKTKIMVGILVIPFVIVMAAVFIVITLINLLTKILVSIGFMDALNILLTILLRAIKKYEFRKNLLKEDRKILQSEE